MSYLNIHTRPLRQKGKVGRPWKRKRRTCWYKKNLRKKDWSYRNPTVHPQPEDEKVFLGVLEKYKLAFEDICRSYLAGYYLEEEYVAESYAGNLIYSKIKSLSVLDMPRDLEKSDVENRLRWIWYQATVRYYRRHPSVSFKNYLFRMSLFELTTWIKATHPIYFSRATEETTQLEQNKSILSYPINSYSKMLLKKYFIDGMTIQDIAKELGYFKSTVSDGITTAVEDLRVFLEL